MGIIFMDGFEKNSVDQWSGGYQYSASAGAALSGNYGLNITAATSSRAYKDLGSNYAELFLTFRYYPTDAGSVAVCSFWDGTTCLFCITRNTGNGYLEARRGSDAATVLATGSTAINADSEHHIKVQYKPLNSGGIIKVYVDNVEDISYSGDTTAGAEYANRLHFGRSNAASGYLYVDDVVLSTTDITKNLRIAGKAITGAGTTTQWDPSAGANYECVDEVPPVHTDYNSTNVTDEIDTFALANCTESIDNIAAVQVEISCAYEGSPTPTKVAAVLRCGSTDYAHATPQSPPSSFGAALPFIWELNPADSAAFEAADINAMEVGYKAVA